MLFSFFFSSSTALATAEIVRNSNSHNKPSAITSLATYHQHFGSDALVKAAVTEIDSSQDKKVSFRVMKAVAPNH